MKKVENSLRMMQFHLAGFIFFQNTSQKTTNHCVSQLKRALWKVSLWQAWGAESLRGAGAAPAAPRSWASPGPWRAPGGPGLAVPRATGGHSPSTTAATAQRVPVGKRRVSGRSCSGAHRCVTAVSVCTAVGRVVVVVL